MGFRDQGVNLYICIYVHLHEPALIRMLLLFFFWRGGGGGKPRAAEYTRLGFGVWGSGRGTLLGVPRI